MNTYDDRRVIAIAERSAVLRSMARIGATAGRAFQHSSLIALLHPIVKDVTARPGLTLVVAAVTHLAVMTMVARPPLWYWLILPLTFVAMGVVLMLMVDERRPRA